MCLIQADYAGPAAASAILAAADQVAEGSPIVAAIMRGATQAAVGDADIAEARTVDAICAIDGKIPPDWAVNAAREHLTPLLVAMEGVRSRQADIVRQLADLPKRIAQGLSAERIGGALGAASVDLYAMARAPGTQAVPA